MKAVYCGDVAVWPGDLLMGSQDGVVVVPGRLIEDVVVEAHHKVQTESEVRVALRNGMNAGEAYKTSVSCEVRAVRICLPWIRML